MTWRILAEQALEAWRERDQQRRDAVVRFIMEWSDQGPPFPDGHDRGAPFAIGPDGVRVFFLVKPTLSVIAILRIIGPRPQPENAGTGVP